MKQPEGFCDPLVLNNTLWIPNRMIKEGLKNENSLVGNEKLSKR